MAGGSRRDNGDPAGGSLWPAAVAAFSGPRGAFGFLLPAVLLILLVLVTYRQAPENGFQFDDRPNIVHNPALRMAPPGLEGLRRAALESPLPARPLAYATFALDWWRGGGEARTFQWTNLALHAANACLVYGLLMMVLGAWAGEVDGTTAAAAAVGAAAWAAHPIQVQAVTYIVQRMAEMASLFTLLAVLLYVFARRARRRGPAVILALAAVLAGTAGALSKENAWVLPLLLVLTELAVVRARRPRLLARWEGVALGGLAAAGLAFSTATLAGVGPLARWLEAGYAGRDFTMVERLLTQPRVVLFHLSQMLWPPPSRFSLEHGFEASRSLLEPASTLPALLAIVALCAAGLWALLRPASRPLGFLLLWIPITLTPESTVVPLELAFEHRMYLPSVGLLGLVAAGLGWLARRLPRPALTVGAPAVALVALLAASTMRYLPVWQTPVTLIENSVRHAPGSVRAWGGLGQAYLEAGRVEDAERALRRCLELDPDDRYSLEYLGVILFDRGDLDTAERHLRRALALGPPSSSLYNHLGEVELARGSFAGAEGFFRLAAQIQPWVEAYSWNLALALEGLGRCNEAFEAWQEVLRLDRDPASRALVEGHLREVGGPGGACEGTPAPLLAGEGDQHGQP